MQLHGACHVDHLSAKLPYIEYENWNKKSVMRPMTMYGKKTLIT